MLHVSPGNNKSFDDKNECTCYGYLPTRNRTRALSSGSGNVASTEKADKRQDGPEQARQIKHPRHVI
jgi:hypothetical protein